MDRNWSLRLIISILLLVFHAITIVSSTNSLSPSPTASLKTQAPMPQQTSETFEGRKSDPGSTKKQPSPPANRNSMNSTPPPPPIKVDNRNIPPPPIKVDNRNIPPPPKGEIGDNTKKTAPSGPDTEKDKKIAPVGPDTKGILNPKKDMMNKSPPPQGGESKENSKMSAPPTNGKDGSESNSENGGNKDTIQDTCDVGAQICQSDALVACLQYPIKELSRSYIVVQNTGDTSLDVEIKVPSSIIIDNKMLHLSKHVRTKIIFSVKDAGSYPIVLTSGSRSCTLHTKSSASPWWNNFQQFRAYSYRLTPIYGSVILVLTVVLVGGTWACCKFRKKARRTDNGVSYQQLEMGARPGSSSIDVNVDTADNWEDGWGNDWDEDEEVARPSEKNMAVTTISSNGLTSRSGIKDGWDVDWDD